MSYLIEPEGVTTRPTDDPRANLTYMVTVRSSYPPESPLLFGTDDGVRRPARMVCRAFGLGVGSLVWVAGDAVDDQVGIFELVEGDVILADLPADPVLRDDLDGIDGDVALDQLEPGGYESSEIYEESGVEVWGGVVVEGSAETAAAPTVAPASGPSRAELEALPYQDVRALAADLDVKPDVSGKPSKAALVDAILAKEG